MNGEELKALRARLGVSRAALARMVGCSVVTITRWEEGKGAPSGLELVVLEELSMHEETFQTGAEIVRKASTDLRAALLHLFGDSP